MVGWEVFSIFQKIDLSHLFCSFEAPRIKLRVIGDPTIMSLIYRDARIEGGGVDIASRWTVQIILCKKSREAQVFQTSSRGKYLTPRDHFW